MATATQARRAAATKTVSAASAGRGRIKGTDGRAQARRRAGRWFSPQSGVGGDRSPTRGGSDDADDGNDNADAPLLRSSPARGRKEPNSPARATVTSRSTDKKIARKQETGTRDDAHTKIPHNTRIHARADTRNTHEHSANLHDSPAPSSSPGGEARKMDEAVGPRDRRAAVVCYTHERSRVSTRCASDQPLMASASHGLCRHKLRVTQETCGRHTCSLSETGTLAGLPTSLAEARAARPVEPLLPRGIAAPLRRRR